MHPELSSTNSTATAVQHPHGDGVVFARRDCAGLIRRLLIDVVDVLVLAGVVGLIVLTTEYGVGASPDAITAIGWFTILFGGWIYLAILKPSRWRTLGFRLFDVRIVTLRGERPSVFRMTCRLLLWVFGPFNQLVDWLWLGGDPARQTLRDKVAGTLVVRSRSVPVTRGPIRVAFYDLFSLNIPFFEVRRSAADERLGGEGTQPAVGRSSDVPVPHTPRTRAGHVMTVICGLCALAGIAWVGSGKWTEFLAQTPRSLVVNNGDQVRYAGTVTRTQAGEVAEFLTDLEYFGQVFPGYAYLDGDADGTELSFFVPSEAWHDSATLEYYEALNALIERRFPTTVVILRTPDWTRARYVESNW